MMRHRLLPAALLLGCAMISCSKDSPFAPGARSITGHVVLRGYFVNERGDFAGTRVIGDATGVPVELLYDTEVVARTTTVGGVYRFTGIPRGGYYVRARVIPGIEDQTEDLVVAEYDVVLRDTLKLASLGDLYPIPNPFADSMTVIFQIYEPEHVVLCLRDLAGQKLRTVMDIDLRPNTWTQAWKMFDHVVPGAPPRLYWLTFESGPDIRAQLLVRQAPVVAAAGSRRDGSGRGSGPLAGVAVR